ncbi:MAG: hypothetical protein IPI06_07270 [Gammaproteobacteria bacterium]|nr:hypothetical protein [Gammaproteobacteria bacterium]
METLRKSPWYRQWPSPEKRHPGNANVCFHGFAAQDALNVMQPSLQLLTGSACIAGIPAPLMCFAPSGYPVTTLSRRSDFSLGFSTSDEDIEDAVQIDCGRPERFSEATVAKSA